MSTAASYARSERRRARPSPRLVSLAATVVAAIAFVTLCPIALRPHLGSANAERFAAYALLGCVVGLSSGRRWLHATALVVLAAFALEAAQGLAPGRHAALSDAMVKALGGVLGSGLAQFAYPLRRLAGRLSDSLASPTRTTLPTR
jgi:hypothetical protein